MKEIKPPRKSLMIYWVTVIAVILLFNVFVEPMLSSVSIKEVDYNTFITMTEEKKTNSYKKPEVEVIKLEKDVSFMTLSGGGEGMTEE